MPRSSPFFPHSNWQYPLRVPSNLRMWNLDMTRLLCPSRWNAICVLHWDKLWHKEPLELSNSRRGSTGLLMYINTHQKQMSKSRIFCLCLHSSMSNSVSLKTGGSIGFTVVKIHQVFCSHARKVFLHINHTCMKARPRSDGNFPRISYLSFTCFDWSHTSVNATNKQTLLYRVSDQI